jgi:hypothetical protein
MKIEPTKIVAFLTAVVTLAGGGYTFGDKLGWFKKDILRWEPEEFRISDGPVNGVFKVIVARQKLRDDCDVLEFRLEVRDSDLRVHPVKPDIAVFAGPAANKVDKFAYGFSFQPEHQSMIALGKAVLLGRIKYKCPEGEVLVQYPRHKNMEFEITK